MSKVYTIRLQNIGIRKFEFVAKTQFLYELRKANTEIELSPQNLIV